MIESSASVLVIGAGPTGLFVAGELARHGVRPRIIEKLSASHVQTRATEVQPAALEALHRAGFAGQLMESSLPMKGLRFFDGSMNEAFTMEIPPAASPYSTTRSIPQWRTEEILTDALTSQGIKVERGVTAERLTMGEREVQVECIDQSGATELIHADYLIGAGGAHSPVRHSLHQDLGGITYPRHYLVADVAVNGVHRMGDHVISVAIAPTGLVMMIELPNGRSLLLTDLPDNRLQGTTPELDDVRAAVANHLQAPLEVSDLKWSSVYRMHRRMSSQFAEGRCFLAGDAAHLCSPMGGEGLNSGILDGASLAWMIAAVLRGSGKPELLAAYEPERQAAARQILMSSEVMHEYYQKLIDRCADGHPLVQPADDPTLEATSGSMLDVKLTESPIVGFHGSALGVQKLSPGCRFPRATVLGGTLHHLLVYGARDVAGVQNFAVRWSRVLTIVAGDELCSAAECGVPGEGAVLVRPDGYVGFLAEKWTPDAMEALDKLLGWSFLPADAA